MSLTPPPLDPQPSTAAPPPVPAVTPEPSHVSSSSSGGNLPMAIVAAIVSAAVGAGLWAFITGLTGYQIGYMAVGVGLLVGIAVQKLGKGNTPVFGIIAAAGALLGCLAGNLLAMSYLTAKQVGVGTFEMLQEFINTGVVEVMKDSFDGMDLLFYGIAVYEAFKFAQRGR